MSKTPPSRKPQTGSIALKPRRYWLEHDLGYFAESCLKIRTKSSGIAPLVFNRAQRHIHERLEQQRAETGRVRAR